MNEKKLGEKMQENWNKLSELLKLQSKRELTDDEKYEIELRTRWHNYNTNKKIEIKTWQFNEINFLKLWRITMENESAINTLFYEIDKLKKKTRKECEKNA